MSEELNNNNTEKTSNSSSPYDALSNMSNQFDPEQAMIARQQTLNEQNRQEYEAVQSKLGGMPNNPAGGYSGETNINATTGKERTYTQWDIHPKMQGETSRDFGDREIKRSDITVLTEFIPREDDPNKTTAENIKAYSKKIEAFENKFSRNDGESLDSYRRRIKGLFEQGALTLEDTPSGGDAKPASAEAGPIKSNPAESSPTNTIETKTGDAEASFVEKANVAETSSNKTETDPVEDTAEQNTNDDRIEEMFFDQYSESNIAQTPPQMAEESQPAQSEDAKKKPGFFGRIRGFFARQREKRAEKKQQKGIDQYEATHPDAVQDVEKARAMAEAGEEIRRIGREYGYYNVAAIEEQANTAEEIEGYIYDMPHKRLDAEKNLNRIGSRPGMAPKAEFAQPSIPRYTSSPENAVNNKKEEFDYTDEDTEDLMDWRAPSNSDPRPPSERQKRTEKEKTESELDKKLEALHNALIRQEGSEEREEHIKGLEKLGLRPVPAELTEEQKALLSDSELMAEYQKRKQEKAGKEEFTKMIDNASDIAWQNEQRFLRNGGYAEMARQDYEKLERLQKEKERYL